jgi:two-component system sensor histidine kinase KdpD
MHTFNVTDTRGETIGRGQILQDISAYRQLDQMKSNLISTVSHELRTPLASIKGYVTTLLADDVEWDLNSQHEFLTIISDEADRLSALVSDLLDLSRIEAGSLKVKRQTSNLEDLIHLAAQRADPSPGKRLQINLPENLPTVDVDRRRIEVVLRNLIENAAKYAGDESPIYVNVTCNQENIIVSVEDEGPGIPDDQRQRIFEGFYRLENGFNRTAPGSGLGLAICQGFVQAHGGNIWVESREQGACFTFSLPRFNDSI